MSFEADALQIASDSGFPLQIAVENAVRATARSTGWSVRYVEHGWTMPPGGESGFIDLVLSNHSARLIVECKRQRHAKWVFMHKSGAATDRRHFVAWMTSAPEGSVAVHRWTATHVDPPHPEATFCAVRGQTSGERSTLLERIGAELVNATEAHAHSERNLRPNSASSRTIYFPVVVTTAELYVTDFQPSQVNLLDGQISQAATRRVPYLRFRKQLQTRFVALSAEHFEGGGDQSYELERSIFVVQAQSLVQFLTQTRFPATFVEV